MSALTRWWRLYRFGYPANQMGIMQRYLREEGGWEYHLERTRSAIIKEVEAAKPQSIVVLGSGWLLDVPLTNMLATGASVTLVDLAHPRRIRHKLNGNPHVTIVDYDITACGLDAAWGYGGRGECHEFSNLIYKLRNPLHSYALSSDLIVSVNLLSQLHFHITDYLTRRNRILPWQVPIVARAIQEAHIEWLPKGKSLLISDFEEELWDDEGRLVGVNPRLQIGIDGGNGSNTSWQWAFDTKRTYLDTHRVMLNVAAARL